MQTWYAVAKPPARLDALTVEMLRQPGKGPKLRSKAGECRYLVPFAYELAKEYDNGTPHRRTVHKLLENFHQVTECISTEPFNAAVAADACRKTCLLFVSLENEALARGDEKSWRVKPKMHMFQELTEYLGPELGTPRNYWTYRDEAWGGWLSKTAERRGGAKWAASVALNLLQRYRALATAEM